MTDVFAQSAFLQALGWSLADSLWQTGMIWAVYALLTGNGKKYTASQRYTLAALSMGAGTLWFIATFFIYYFVSPASSLTRPGTGLLQASHYEIGSDAWLSRAAGIASAAYVFTVFTLLVRLTIMYIRSLQPGLPPPATHHPLLSFVERTAKQLGINKKIRLIITGDTETPATVGFLRPVILLPIAAINGLSLYQVEAVICHELIHIRRNDFLLNILLSFAGMLMFYNPFARMLLNVASKEREHACDDGVIRMGYDGWQYSEALYKLGRYGFEKELSLAAAGKSRPVLLQRIKRMMNRKDPRPSLVKPLVVFFLCLLPSALLNLQRPRNIIDQPAMMEPAFVVQVTEITEIFLPFSPGLPPPGSEKQPLGPEIPLAPALPSYPLPPGTIVHARNEGDNATVSPPERSQPASPEAVQQKRNERRDKRSLLLAVAKPERHAKQERRNGNAAPETAGPGRGQPPAVTTSTHGDGHEEFPR